MSKENKTLENNYMDLKLIIKVEQENGIDQIHFFDDLDEAQKFLRNIRTEIANKRLTADAKGIKLGFNTFGNYHVKTGDDTYNFDTPAKAIEKYSELVRK